MNAYNFGRYISTSRGLQRALGGAARVYTGQGALESAFFVGGALSPFVGPIAAGVATTGLAVYGGKQIYDGLRDLF
jgi:hypothetical protein